MKKPFTVNDLSQIQQHELVTKMTAQMFKNPSGRVYEYNDSITRLLCLYNIDKAIAIVGKSGAGLASIEAHVPTLYKLIHTGRVEISPEHALKNADIGIPIIAVPCLGNRVNVIDGWHRIFRAFVEGYDVLPVHLLSIEQTLEITIFTNQPNMLDDWNIQRVAIKNGIIAKVGWHD